MATLDDPTNSACDLRIPHKQAIAALLLGTVTEATGAKWMEENFLEIERWVRFAHLNSCFGSSSLPNSECCEVEVYNGLVDSYTIGATVDTSAWTGTHVLAMARIWVQNNTGGSGLVELDGGFNASGTTLSGTRSELIRLTLADGEGILLSDHCTIASDAALAYSITNVGSIDATVCVNATFTETAADQACCTGPM